MGVRPAQFFLTNKQESDQVIDRSFIRLSPQRYYWL